MAPKIALFWSRTECQRLIELYEANPCLYNVVAPNYHNRNMRQAALESIAAEMRVLRPEVTAEAVKLKLSNLRSQYSEATAKLRRSRVSGCGTDSVATPSLWCWRELAFLEPNIIHVKGFTNIAEGREQASSGVGLESGVEDQVNRFDQIFNQALSDLDDNELPRPASAPLLRCQDMPTPVASGMRVSTLLAAASEPPLAGTSRPPVAGTSRPPVAGTSRPPVAGTSRLPLAGTSRLPLAGTSRPPVAGICREGRRGSVGSAPGSSRGSKRKAGLSPVREQDVYTEATHSMLDLVSSRVDTVHDPYMVRSFGTFIGNEMLRLKSYREVLQLKEEIFSSVRARQLARSPRDSDSD